MTVTSGGMSGSMSGAYSVDTGSTSVLMRSNGAGTGSAWVTVHGSGLGMTGLTGMSWIGDTGCEGTEWESETSVRCLTGHGYGGTRRMMVTSGGMSGSLSETYSVDTGSASVLMRSNGAGTGSAWVTVHGSGLGMTSLSMAGRMGASACEGTEWESETLVWCHV